MQDSSKAVHFDEQNYLDQISKIEENAGQFQTTIDKINALNLDITFEPGDLVPLFADPTDFFTKKMVTDPMTVNGLNLDSKKVFDLLETPPELKAIIAQIEQSKPMYLQSFVIQENTVIIKPEYLENLKLQYSIFLTNENQRIVYNNLNQIMECLEGIKKVYSNFRPVFLFERYLKTNAESTICKIDFAEIKRIQ